MNANLVMIRHGRSLGNERKLVNNEQQNILSASGLADALGKAMKFKEENPTLVFDKVFCSSLPRAVQTCYNFLSTIEHPAIEVELVDSLMERDFGIAGYLGEEKIAEMFGPGEMNAWFNDLNHRPCGAGETPMELYQRATSAFNALVLPHIRNGKMVLVVSHYATMGALAAYIEHNDFNKTLSYSFKNAVPHFYRVDY